MKTTREQLDIINAYQELGSYRAAARLCGTSDKTVKRVRRIRRTAEIQTARLSTASTRASFPPAADYAQVPACVMRVYGRPQRSTFGEDNGRAQP